MVWQDWPVDPVGSDGSYPVPDLLPDHFRHSFRRKLLELTGPSLSGRKITLQVLDEITDPIQSYLQVQIFTSALVAVLTGLALMAQGLQNAAVLGIVACVLNLAPYVGALITASTSGPVAFFAGWLSRHGTGHLRGFSRDPYAG